MQGSIYTWPVGKGGSPARHVLGTCWACRPKLLPMKLAPWGSQTWGQFPLSGRGGGYQVRLPGGGVPYLMGQAKLAGQAGVDRILRFPRAVAWLWGQSQAERNQ